MIWKGRKKKISWILKSGSIPPPPARWKNEKKIDANFDFLSGPQGSAGPCCAAAVGWFAARAISVIEQKGNLLGSVQKL